MLKTKISTLSNGLKVATHESNGHFVTAGLFVKAGSRHEKKHLRGCNSFLEKMTFKSTAGFKSEDLIKEFEQIGGQLSSTAHREYFSVQGSVFKKDLRKLISLISEVIMYINANYSRPSLEHTEISDAKINTEFEIDQEEFNFQVNLPDKLHQLAYRNTLENPSSLSSYDTNTLGISNRISKELLSNMNKQSLIEFRELFSPDRMVLASVGTNHGEMLELAEKEFGHLKRSEIDPSIDMEPHYSGGTFVNNVQKKSPNPDDMVLTHMHMAYEAPGVHDPDIYSLATLGALLGGGGILD